MFTFDSSIQSFIRTHVFDGHSGIWKGKMSLRFKCEQWIEATWAHPRTSPVVWLSPYACAQLHHLQWLVTAACCHYVRPHQNAIATELICTSSLPLCDITRNIRCTFLTSNRFHENYLRHILVLLNCVSSYIFRNQSLISLWLFF